MFSLKSTPLHHPHQNLKTSKRVLNVIVAATSETSNKSNPRSWPTFCSNVTGEWVGVSSRFAADGKPQPLPAQYVPDAYRQWNVQLYDWQTVVTSKADPDAPGKLQLVCRRLMPTVGCEPDYVAYFEDRSGDAEASKGAAAVTHTPILPQLEVAIAEDDGSYISAPSSLPKKGPVTVEVGVARGVGEGGKAQRVRLVHHLDREAGDSVWELLGVDVHNESFDGQFRGQVELCGCNGGMSPFATTERLPAEMMGGSWHTTSSESIFDDEAGGGNDGCPGNMVPLPLQLWMKNSVGGTAGDFSLEVGVLTQGGAGMKVASVSYLEGSLIHCSMVGQEKV